MKNARTALLALFSAAIAVPALADTASPAVTREQVKAEYIRALKAGELDYSREFTGPVVTRQSANTSAASKIENLSPTGAGNRDVTQSAAVATDKTAN